MRKIMFASVALVGLMLAGTLVWTAEAATGAGTLGLEGAAKPYSLIEKAACKFGGPTCPIGYTCMPHVEMLVRALPLRQRLR
jgi:hypothetical protein